VLAGLCELVAPHLTEKRRRLLAGAAARALGRGGGARMARLSGLSRPTGYTGVRELDAPPDPRGRVRRPGGGPKRLAERDPGLLQALEELVDPDTGGDPQSPLRWTCTSTRELAEALTARGIRSAMTRSGGCCGGRITRCSAPESPRRAPSIPTGMCSSATSTSRPASTWLLPSR
jgi:hypothetical protein